MFGFITRFFGNKKDKDVAALKPLVAQINQQYESLRPLSDDQLRNKSREFKKKIKEAYASLDAQMDKWTAEIKTLDVVNQESIFEQIDKLKKEKNKVIEEALMNILPEAFAVVKETSRRLTENKQLVVTATEWDQLIASKKANVQIQDGKAIWLNQWTAAGAQIEWNMIHYDVQLIGGMALHQGKISEMATGEGKTLVATLPTYLNALAGQGVHIVTVNDYLARRDCEWNAPIFEFHELSVDVIDIHKPNSDTRKNAYLADITYGTNNEFGFDYLRDNMVTHPDHLVQRQLHYAIVDEVDSILIDDARTPLIIAGPAPQGDRHEFDILRPRIEAIVEEQRKLVNQCLSEAKKLIANGEQDKGGVQLLRAHRGLPRHSALLRYQNEPGIKVLLQKTENYYMQDNSKNMYKIDDELFFVMDEKNNQVELTDKGRDMITLAGEDPNLFVLPDLANLLSEIEVDTHISPEEKYHQKDMLFRNYAEKSERLHSIHQLLKAYCLFEINKQYVVMEGKVMIVDEGTGRILDGRRYSDGLHQAIEAKERVKIEAATQTFATVTLQNYFRMYHKLAGMTGTAETEAKEFWDIYKLDVVSIPTNKPILRKDLDDKVYKTRKEKFNAIVQEVQELRAKGRPILVGTTDVEVSEYLSKVFTAHKIPHNLLNAKHHQKEAEIVAQAGQAGMVTIATNMAGRGTDIKLGDGVREAGGLAIIGSERHESRRVDRQLRGRSGRQGDPGSSQFFVSLEDNLMRQFGSERIAKVMDWLKVKEGEVIQHSMITKSITNSQRKVEENNFSMRKRLLEYDDVMNYQRETIYGRRKNALFGERLQLDIDNMLWDLSATLVAKYYAEGEPAGLNYDCIRYLAVDPGITEKEMDATKQDAMTNKVYTLARQKYDKSMTELAGMVYHASENLYKHLHSQYHTDPNFEDNLSSVVVEVRLSDGQKTANIGVDLRSILDSQGNAAPMLFEKTVILGIIDEEYKDHLRTMDDLRQSVQNAVYEQKDPLLVYKFESNQIFNNLLYEINTAALAFLMKAQMVTHAEPETHAPVVEERDDFSKLKTSHPDTSTQYTYEYVESNKSKPTHIQEEDDDFNDDFEMEDSEESVDGKNLSRRERRELERKNKKKK